MASVGSVTCDLVARIPSAQSETAEIEKSRAPGTDGAVYRVLGTAPGGFIFRAFKKSTSEADATTWVTAMEALQQATTAVTITDDRAREFTNCLIERVVLTRDEKNQAGGGTAVWWSEMHVYGTFT